MNYFYRGESTSLTVTVFVDGEAVAIDSGSPDEVTELEYTLRVGPLEGVDVPAVTKTKTGGGIVLSAQSGSTLGQAVVDINSADTAALTPGLYFEKVRVQFANDPGEWHFVIPPQQRVVYGS